jgi:phosphoenolpyruvate carboxykinase (ATP)
MSIDVTRALLTAALEGALDSVETDEHPVFRVLVPRHCPGVSPELLDPRSTWTDAAVYDATAAKLARLFSENFERFAGRVSPDVAAAGPLVTVC